MKYKTEEEALIAIARFRKGECCMKPATGIEDDWPQVIVWVCVVLIGLAVAWIPAKGWIAWLMQ